MAGDRAPNWKRIQAEYVRGGISYRDLAAKHGVSFNTLQDRARREGWAGQARQKHDIVTTELPARVAEVQLSEAERATREDLEVLGAAVTQARGILAACTDPQGLKDWAAGFKAIQACRRLALGLDDSKGGVADAASTPAPAPADDGRRELGAAELDRRIAASLDRTRGGGK